MAERNAGCHEIALAIGSAMAQAAAHLDDQIALQRGSPLKIEYSYETTQSGGTLVTKRVTFIEWVASAESRLREALLSGMIARRARHYLDRLALMLRQQ